MIAGKTLPNQFEQSGTTILRYLHEALLSLNVASILVFASFLFAPAVLVPLAHMEVIINSLLHIRQTDFIRGYFELFIPAVVLAALIWAFLRVSSGTRAALGVLKVAGGVFLFFSPAIFWFFRAPRGRSLKMSMLELSLGTVFLVFYLRNKRRVCSAAVLVLLTIHYSFWFWLFGNPIDWSPSPGTVIPILALPSAIVWITFRDRCLGISLRR